MANNYDATDLDFTWDGDLMISPTGDLLDTSDDLLRSIRNEIQSVLKSDLGDWREDPSIGADLSDFVGEPNSRQTAQNIQARVESALAQILFLSDLSVRIIPVNIHQVLIMLSLAVLPTPANKLQSGQVISISFVYDYLETGVYIDISEIDRFTGRAI